jgi:hypothetical protein
MPDLPVYNLEIFFWCAWASGVCYLSRCGELKRRFNGREMEQALDKKPPANTTVSYSELLNSDAEHFVEHFLILSHKQNCELCLQTIIKSKNPSAVA